VVPVLDVYRHSSRIQKIISKYPASGIDSKEQMRQAFNRKFVIYIKIHPH